MENRTPSNLETALQSPIFWGCFSTTIAIVLSVVAAMIHDVRWILAVAWPFAGFAVFEFARICSKRKSIVWSSTGMGTVASAILLGWLYVELAPVESPSIKVSPSTATIVPSTPEQPTQQLQSTLAKMIYTCPPSPTNRLGVETVKQGNEQIRKNMEVLGPILGMALSLTDIPNGIRFEMVPNTPEGQTRAGAATKLIVEGHRLSTGMVVTVETKIPSPLQEISENIHFPIPDQEPAKTQGKIRLNTTDQLVRSLFGFAEGDCHLI
jgi:hypothetical protein